MSIIGAIVQWLICRKRGHDNMVTATGSHVFLRCAWCGRESSGFKIEGQPRKIERFKKRLAKP